MINTIKAYKGKMDAIMPTGDYFAIETSNNPETRNSSLWNLWDICNREIAKISTTQAAQNTIESKDLLTATFKSISIIFAATVVRIRTRANDLFTRTYGEPRKRKYEDYPIRWTGESRLALDIVLTLSDAVFAIPQVKCNVLEEGILDNHAALILKPIYSLKARLMREYFAKEIKGEVSIDELEALFAKAKIQPPLLTSLLDIHDTPADLDAEKIKALGDESAIVPTGEQVIQVKSGVEVWTWEPTEADWLICGEILKRYENSGVVQIPPEPFPFTTGTISNT